MKLKLAVVIIPSHWDPRDLVHPSVNESGSVYNGSSVFHLARDDSQYRQEIIGTAERLAVGAISYYPGTDLTVLDTAVMELAQNVGVIGILESLFRYCLSKRDSTNADNREASAEDRGWIRKQWGRYAAILNSMVAIMRD